VAINCANGESCGVSCEVAEADETELVPLLAFEELLLPKMDCK
jgi:hypothetical protein